MTGDETLLRLDRVSIAFGGVQAVRGVSFTVAPGRVTSLIGGNGAGKTTVFNLITGYLRPDAGTIWYRGRQTSGLAPHPQHGHCWSTIRWERAFRTARRLRDSGLR